jgi:presenilin-like A22 family membrane protease
MKHIKSLTLLCAYYMLTIILGLNTAHILYPLMHPPAGQQQLIEPIVSDSQGMGATIHLFTYIILVTLVMLALMRAGQFRIIRFIVGLSFLGGIFLSTYALFGDAGIIPTTIMALTYILKNKNPHIINILLIFTLSGFGAILGISVGFPTALAFILIMSAYDLIAVFITKHMVELAKTGSGKIPLMFSIPVGSGILSLGAGDIALPVVFTVSVYTSHGIGYAMPTAYGGLLGIIALFYYILGKAKTTLPALPPITAGLLTGYALALMTLPIP